MTFESGQWPDHHDPSLPQETKTSEPTRESDNKRILDLGHIFEGMLAIANGPRPLELTPGNMADFDLNNSRVLTLPNKHLATYALSAGFDDGIFFRTTTKNIQGTVASVHTLQIYAHDPDRITPDDIYRVTRGINNSRSADPVDTYMIGLEQIAEGINDLYDFGGIVRAFEDEAAGGWQNRLSKNTLKLARDHK